MNPTAATRLGALALLLAGALLGCDPPPALESDPDTLSFCSHGSVSAEEADRLVREAAAEAQPSWAAPLRLVAPPAFFGRHLKGSLRLYLRDYETPDGRLRTVAPADEAVMACATLRAALARLSAWSATGIEWHLRLGASKARLPGDTAALERQVCAGARGDPVEIARKYPGRP